MLDCTGAVKIMLWPHAMVAQVRAAALTHEMVSSHNKVTGMHWFVQEREGKREWGVE